MTEVMLEQLPLFSEALEARLEGLEEGPRVAAARAFAQRGLPGPKDEAWRQTPLAGLLKRKWQLAPRPGREAVAAIGRQLAAWRKAGCWELVWVDGWWIPELSSAEAPPGVAFRSLAGALEGSVCVEAGLAEQPFALLAAALFSDGASIEVSPHTVVERPIHLLFWTQAGPDRVIFPRFELSVGEGAEVRVIETHASELSEPYWVLPITEVRVGERAICEHVRIQRETKAGFHLARMAYELQRQTTLKSHSFAFGGELFRQDIVARLLGEGSEATLNGLYLVEDRQHADTYMRVDHLAPHTTSHELYKGVLDGRARSVFSGRIHVHPGALKTDAKQTNRNLLLSREALAHSQPQLEIYADDVKCTHGSTVGQLDEEAVFYLRSRGIGLEAAQSLLTYAFAAEVVEQVGLEIARRELQEFLFRWVPQGDVVRDAV